MIVCLLHGLCKGQTYFNNYYITDYTSLGTTNIFMESVDSSFTFFSYTKNVAGGRQDFTTSRIDKNGILLQNKNHNINNLDYGAFLNGFKQFIPATKSSYFCVATNAASINVTLNKLSRSTLDTLFTKNYTDQNYNYYLNNYLKFNDNKYYLIGNQSDAIGNQKPVIFHLDSNLNILNIIAVNTGSLSFSINNAVYNPINKKIIFGGYKNISNDQVDLFFVESDTLGVVSNSIVISNGNINNIGQLQYCSFDNSYVFCGYSRTSKVSGISYNRLQLTKLNGNNLNIVWRKTYGSGLLVNNLNSLLVNSNGSIISCGRFCDSTYAFQVSGYDAGGVILKVNSVGDSLWMRQYNNYVSPPNPNNYFETLFGIEKSYDGGYIACGGIINQPQGKAWVIKMDSLGCVNAGCGGVISGTLSTGIAYNPESSKEYVQIYPNPSSEFLNIEIASGFVNNKAAYELEIVNALGQKVFTDMLSEPKTKVDIKMLDEGFYFIRIKKDSKLVESFKFIKQ